jgi:hypothetical protein
MGGNSGFTKAVKPLVKDFVHVDQDHLLVDVSYLMHQLHYKRPSLAYKMFKMHSYDQRVIQDYASRLHEAIQEFVHPVYI